MSTSPLSAQKTCSNIWHRNPGALLKCPHCNMTLTELAEQKQEVLARARANGANVGERPQPPMRIGLRYFEHSDPQQAVGLANEYANKLSVDGRIRIVDASTGTRRASFDNGSGNVNTYDVFYVVFVTNMVIG